MLINSRVSLFVIYPSLKVYGPALTLSEGSAETEIGEDNPFSGDINFRVFVNETGGKLFFNRNDVDREIERSEQLGSQYYTLTYEPAGGSPNGKFRRIRQEYSGLEAGNADDNIGHTGPQTLSCD